MNILDILDIFSRITLGIDRMNIYAMICLSGMLTYGFYKAYKLKGLNPLFLCVAPTTAHFYYQSLDFVGQIIFGITRADPIEYFTTSFDIGITLIIYLVSATFVFFNRKYLSMLPLYLMCIFWTGLTFLVMFTFGVNNMYVLEGTKRAIYYGFLYIPAWTTLAISYFWFWRR